MAGQAHGYLAPQLQALARNQVSYAGLIGTRRNRFCKDLIGCSLRRDNNPRPQKAVMACLAVRRH